MKFKLDENMPASLALLLRRAGHDVSTVPEQGLAGSEDETVLRIAASESRLLLTLDKGLADVRLHQKVSTPGVVVFRLVDEGAMRIGQAAQRILDAGGFERMRGCLTVVEETRIRIRKT